MKSLKFLISLAIFLCIIYEAYSDSFIVPPQGTEPLTLGVKTRDHDCYTGTSLGTNSMAYAGKSRQLVLIPGTTPADNTDLIEFVKLNEYNSILTDVCFDDYINTLRRTDGRFITTLFFRSFDMKDVDNNSDKMIAILKNQNDDYLRVDRLEVNTNERPYQAIINRNAAFKIKKESRDEEISFFDVVDLRSLASEPSKLQGDLQKAYGIIGTNRGNLHIFALEQKTSVPKIQTINLKSFGYLAGGCLGVIKDTNKLAYYVSIYDGLYTKKITISKLKFLKGADGSLQLVKNGQEETREVGYPGAMDDPLMRIVRKQHHEKAPVEIGMESANLFVQMGNFEEVKADPYSNTWYEPEKITETRTDKYSRAKAAAQSEGLQLFMLVMGPPYCVKAINAEDKPVSKLKLEKEFTSESYNAVNNTVDFNCEFGGKLKIVVAEASNGIFANISKKWGKEHKTAQVLNKGMEVEFKAFDEDAKIEKESWSAGTGFYKRTRIRLSAYGYIKPSNAGSDRSINYQLQLEGLNGVEFAIMVPLCEMKYDDDDGLTSLNFDTQKTDLMCQRWQGKVWDKDIRDFSIFTDGIPNAPISHQLVYDEKIGLGDQLEKILKYQKDLNLEVLFELGNDNEMLKGKKGNKPNVDYTGVTKAFGQQKASKWGYSYNAGAKGFIGLSLTDSDTETTSFSTGGGWHYSVQPSMGFKPIMGGPYADVKLGYTTDKTTRMTKEVKDKLMFDTSGSDRVNAQFRIAVAHLNVAQMKSYMWKKNNEIKKPNFVSKYAWETNQSYLIIIPWMSDNPFHMDL